MKCTFEKHLDQGTYYLKIILLTFSDHVCAYVEGKNISYLKSHIFLPFL